MGADPPLGIAGARLADGRQVFVADAPPDLAPGARVALWWDDREQHGTVSIPPRLVMWRDPEAVVGRFLGLLDPPIGHAAQWEESDQPLALFLADGGPEPDELAAMLALARAETDRLDD
ncbi:MAG TPA: hypothetical protein VNL71_22720 [Chloroflexota bacterium]|nr:hypothetical protein [Chloroflexota bacterium]